MYGGVVSFSDVCATLMKAGAIIHIYDPHVDPCGAKNEIKRLEEGFCVDAQFLFKV